ncbi:MAG: HAD family phosphatase [Micrococcales bacterium]|nr:HAD family phosphatase [Micrococcales bacterium]
MTSTLPAAVLWDMDGTLVDTEPYWIRAEHEIVAAAGGVWDDELAHQLVGNDLMVSAEFIRAHSPIEDDPLTIVEELLRRVIAQVREHIPWRPGARELLSELHAAGVPCALVTMSWRSLAATVAEALPPGSMQVVIAGDDVTHGKPHPEPYLAACRALGVEPADCVALEDSPTGVRSATAAGVPTIGVPHVVPIPAIDGSVLVETLQGVRGPDLLRLTATVDARR